MSTQSNSKSVPLLDLKAQYKQVGPEIEELLLAVLRSGQYILGEVGKQLEELVAGMCGTQYGIGVANGTDALTLALWAAGIRPGDEVITPSFTFAATAEAIALRGARPVFVEVDPVTFNIDPEAIKPLINAKTRAIIPVHLYGQPADMEPIMALAQRFGLFVIEDNAQAIGATYKGKPTGSFGHMSCISFYPTKNLGAAGDAGMVVTSDAELAERLRTLRAHGSKQRYYHEELGVNSRLDELQAAVLMAKLPYLKEWNDKRNQVARWYGQAFKNVAGIITPSVSLRSTHVWHQYTIRVSSTGSARLPITRDQLAKDLAARGIGSMCYYPVPLHLQQAFLHYGYRRGSLPVSEMLADEVLSLPMYPELEEWQVKAVAGAVQEIINARLASGLVQAPSVVAGF